MKSLLIATLLLSLSYVSFGQTQTPGVQSFFDKYSEIEEATTVEISGWLLRKAANMVEDEEGKKIAKGLHKLNILALEGQNPVNQGEFKQLVKNIRNDQFEDLMKIRDGKTTVDLMIKDNGDRITNVVMLVNDYEDFFLLNLECNLDFSQLNDIDIDLEGTDIFKKIPEKRKDVPRA